MYFTFYRKYFIFSFDCSPDSCTPKLIFRNLKSLLLVADGVVAA